MSEILRIAVSSASASQTYQYQPLQHPDSIRRIKLLPGSGDAPLLCTLSEVRLLDSPTPTYKAISYTWGKPIFSHQIREVESGQDIRITKSLFEALKAIRSKSEHSLLWADAICINQASDEERNHQVAFMTQIYKNASGVLVWLGMLSEDSTNTLHSVLKSMRKDHYTAWSTSCIYDDFFENLAIEFFSLPWYVHQISLYKLSLNLGVFAYSPYILFATYVSNSSSGFHVFGLFPNIFCRRDTPFWLRMSRLRMTISGN